MNMSNMPDHGVCGSWMHSCNQAKKATPGMSWNLSTSSCCSQYWKEQQWTRKSLSSQLAGDSLLETDHWEGDQQAHCCEIPFRTLERPGLPLQEDPCPKRGACHHHQEGERAGHCICLKVLDTGILHIFASLCKFASLLCPKFFFKNTFPFFWLWVYHKLFIFLFQIFYTNWPSLMSIYGVTWPQISEYDETLSRGRIFQN